MLTVLYSPEPAEEAPVNLFGQCSGTRQEFPLTAHSRPKVVATFATSRFPDKLLEAVSNLRIDWHANCTFERNVRHPVKRGFNDGVQTRPVSGRPGYDGTPLAFNWHLSYPIPRVAAQPWAMRRNAIDVKIIPKLPRMLGDEGQIHPTEL